jgi:hypothetical protein
MLGAAKNQHFARSRIPLHQRTKCSMSLLVFEVPPYFSRSSSNNFAFVASVFAPSASPVFKASCASFKKFFTLLTCAFSSSAFCADSAFNRFSLEAIRSAASCFACGFASPPAVNAPIAVSSGVGGGVAFATCTGSGAGVTFGAGFFRSRLGFALDATGTAGSLICGVSTIGRSSGSGIFSSATGAITGGKGASCGLCRHPARTTVNPKQSTVLASLRVMSPLPFKLVPLILYEWPQKQQSFVPQRPRP